MNWSNTQFDGKYQITIGCARRVGEIMKYLDEGDEPQMNMNSSWKLRWSMFFDSPAFRLSWESLRQINFVND